MAGIAHILIVLLGLSLIENTKSQYIQQQQQNNPQYQPQNPYYTSDPATYCQCPPGCQPLAASPSVPFGIGTGTIFRAILVIDCCMPCPPDYTSNTVPIGGGAGIVAGNAINPSGYDPNYGTPFGGGVQQPYANYGQVGSSLYGISPTHQQQQQPGLQQGLQTWINQQQPQQQYSDMQHQTVTHPAYGPVPHSHMNTHNWPTNTYAGLSNTGLPAQQQIVSSSSSSSQLPQSQQQQLNQALANLASATGPGIYGQQPQQQQQLQNTMGYGSLSGVGYGLQRGFDSGQNIPTSTLAGYGDQYGNLGSGQGTFGQPNLGQSGSFYQQGGNLAASTLASGEPGYLTNYRGDRYTDPKRIQETRALNQAFYDSIGGEPQYPGANAPTPANPDTNFVAQSGAKKQRSINEGKAIIQKRSIFA